MIIETERLILRSFDESDYDDMFEYISDAEAVEYEPYKAMTPEEARKNLEWCISTEEMIAVELKDTHKVIGNIYLGNREFNSIEIGYVFNKKYWHKGYAKEGCKALIEKKFSDGIHRIYAECDPLNPNSWRLLESLGLKREADLKQNIYFWKDENGEPIWKDTFIYGLVNKNK